VKNLESSPERLQDFLMDFHHKESLPKMSRAYKTAITLAVSYFLGGLIPLVPYFVVPKNEVRTALWWSIGVMGITLLTFGYLKTCIVLGWTGKRNVQAGAIGGLQMLVVGAAAAGAAVGFVRAIERGGHF
jgi:vacuolar iron transporter family protein